MKRENEKELLPCPFCPIGGEPVLRGKGERWYIVCWKCKARGGRYDDNDSTSPEEAAEFWNTRSPASPSKAPERSGEASIEQVKEAIAAAPPSVWSAIEKLAPLPGSEANYAIIGVDLGRGDETRISMSLKQYETALKEAREDERRKAIEVLRVAREYISSDSPPCICHFGPGTDCRKCNALMKIDAYDWAAFDRKAE